MAPNPLRNHNHLECRCNYRDRHRADSVAPHRFGCLWLQPKWRLRYVTLGLLSDYASDGASAARLTAMAFSVTYTVAAFGPFAAGLVMDTVQSWTLVFLLLAVVTLLQLLTVPFLKRRITID